MEIKDIKRNGGIQRRNVHTWRNELECHIVNEEIKKNLKKIW